MGKMNFIVIKGGDVYDMSELVISVSWQGRRGAAARSLNVSLLDDYEYAHKRSYIKVEEGHQCIFSYDGTELFRGMIMKQSYSNKKTMSIYVEEDNHTFSDNKHTMRLKLSFANDIKELE